MAALYWSAAIDGEGPSGCSCCALVSLPANNYGQPHCLVVHLRMLRGVSIHKGRCRDKNTLNSPCSRCCTRPHLCPERSLPCTGKLYPSNKACFAQRCRFFAEAATKAWRSLMMTSWPFEALFLLDRVSEIFQARESDLETTPLIASRATGNGMRSPSLFSNTHGSMPTLPS